LRRRVRSSQAAIVLQRADRIVCRQSIRQTDFVTFTVANRFHAAADAFQIFAVRLFGLKNHVGIHCGGERRNGSVRFEAVFDFIEPCFGQYLVFMESGIHQIDRVLLMVEGNQTIGEHQACIRLRSLMQTASAAFCLQFVAEVTDKSAIEIKWQIGRRTTPVSIRSAMQG